MQDQRQTTNLQAAKRRFIWIRLLVLAAFMVGIFSLRRELNLAQYFSREQMGHTLDALRAWIGGFGAWGFLVFAAACSATFIVYCPMILVVFVSVTLYGPVLGCLLSLLIVAIGSSLVHMAAHHLGRPVVQRLMGRRMEKIEARFSQRELMNVILLRLVLFTNPALNWALGLSGIRYRNLLLGTVLGTAPAIILLGWLSGELVEFVQSGTSSRLLKHPVLLIPIILAAALFRGNWLFDRMARMKHGTPAAHPPAPEGTP